MEAVKLLEAEQFNISTTQRLDTHPILAAAGNGSLDIDSIKRFVLEQYYVIKSDTKSLQSGIDLHGDISSSYREFFQFFLSGELYAAELHSKMVEALHISQQELDNYEPSHMCQAYPAKFCQIVHQNDPAIVAIAFAVNFPAWGKMCGKFRDALLANYSDKLSLSEESLGFVSYFAEPIECLPELVDKVATASKNLGQYRGAILHKEIRDAVRLLQEYEVLFWDGVFLNQK